MTTQYVALKYVNDGPKHKYLGLVADGSSQGYLQYNVTVNDPTAKFALEPAKKAGYVHIRSCYNNKYWVRSSEDDYWIVATATSIEEDTTLWNCTMFEKKTVPFQDTTSLQLTHVQLNRPIGLPSSSGAKQYCLCLPPLSTSGTAALSFEIDYNNLVFLPPKVSFSQCIDGNVKYLGIFYQQHALDYFAFAKDDPADEDATNNVITTDDGNVILYNAAYEGYWTSVSYQDGVNPDWLLPIAMTNNFSDPKSMFWVDKVSPNVIALRNLGTKKYCQRRTVDSSEPVVNGVFADATTMLATTHFTVCEPVIRRTITTNFRMEDSRIYGETPIVLAEQQAINTRKSPMTMSVGFSYEKTQSYTWNNSMTVTLGIQASFESGIPLIAEGTITVSAEFSDTYSWGSTVEESKTLTSSCEVDVPAESTVTVYMMATKGYCDVPFSYTQTDLLDTGETVTTTLYDGIYTGINAYKFYYKNV